MMWGALRGAGEKEMTMPKVTQLDHVALSARDPDTIARFYEDFLGLRVLGRLGGNRGVFLATANRPGGPDIEFFAPADRQDGVEQRLTLPHVALRVDALADLQASQREVKRHGGAFVTAVNHGAVISCRVLDPEGNQIDLTWVTGFPMPRTLSLSPIDLEQSEADVMRQLQATMT